MPSPAVVADPTTPLLRGRIRSVFRHLPKALAGDEESIHQMRVAGRRLRVALPVLARKPDGKRVRRALRRLRELTRAAGSSRDLDVSVGLFEARVGAIAGPGGELRALLRRLRAARTRSRRHMAEALLDLEIAGLRRDLRAVLSRRADGLFVALVRVREERERLAAEALASLASLGDRFEPDALHLVRRRARRLRYTAEIGDALRGQDGEAPALFKRLQEQLGWLHDAWVLSTWLGRQAESSRARGQRAIAAEARAQEAFFLEESRRHHHALLALDPAEVVRRGVEAMGGARSVA